MANPTLEMDTVDTEFRFDLPYQFVAVVIVHSIQFISKHTTLKSKQLIQIIISPMVRMKYN